MEFGSLPKRPLLPLGLPFGLSTLAALALLGAPTFAQSLPAVPVPTENPITGEKVLLGQALFWEEQLSSTNTVACGTCHIPSAGGSDPRSDLFPLDSTHPGPDGVRGTVDDKVGSLGVPWTLADGRYWYDPDFGMGERVTFRHTPSMINAAYHATLFWDGRAETTFVDPIGGQVISQFDAALESQALGPILSSTEMGHEGRTWDEVTSKLAAIEPLLLAENIPSKLSLFIDQRKYPELFGMAFSAEPNPTAITPVRIAQAIATYERTLVSDQTPFDQWLNGDSSAFTGPEKRGNTLFGGQAMCSFCHFGGFLTDFNFHNIGVRPPAEDSGVFEITGTLSDRGLFKTPGLRNLSLRQHYFHHGGATSIAEVVDHYIVGGVFLDNLSPNIIPLTLTSQERSDLIAFLTTGLLDPRVANETGPFERPTLYSESSTRQPTTFGSGTPGTNGDEPRIVAIEPAFLGNPNFTLGITHSIDQVPVFFAADISAAPPGGFQVLGATLNLGLTPSFSIAPLGVLLPDGYGGGWHSVVCAIPTAPSLVGTNLYGQWFVLDPGAVGPVAASEGLTVPVF